MAAAAPRPFKMRARSPAASETCTSSPKLLPWSPFITRLLDVPLGFHDGPHSLCGNVRMLLDQPLRGRERREGPVAGRGRPVTPAHVEQDLGDAPLHPQVRPQSVALQPGPELMPYAWANDLELYCERSE